MKNDTNSNQVRARLQRRPLRHLNEFKEGINVSFEYFPARNQFALNQLRRTSRLLDRLQPRFVSVTYGAGGCVETESFRTLRLLSKVTSRPVAAHLTNIGASREELDTLVERIAMMGISRIVALRGDDKSTEESPGVETAYASTVEMVRGIRALHDFDISVAGYPETHPAAVSPQADLDFLKRKIDAGANRVICQFCFDSDRFLRFRDRAVREGISVPIIAGVLPIHDYGQAKTFSEKCGADIPASLDSLFGELPRSREIFQVVSSTVTAEFCTRLIDNGVTNLHFYTLNRSTLVRAVCQILGLQEQADTETAVIGKAGSGR